MNDNTDNGAQPPLGATLNLGVAGHPLIRQLLASSLISTDDWDRLLPQIREELAGCSKSAEVLAALTYHGLLTNYQAERIGSGGMEGLVLGNYRIVEKIGAGSMGTVYKAEHIDLRRLVAVKVLALSRHLDPRILERFTGEMRAVARLQHPNIVAAMDAGKFKGDDPDAPELRYFVMEYVPGQDLQECVEREGPMPLNRACDLIHQIASALAEASEHNLVHRDIKPSNVRVTPEGQAKLLDFGLAMNWRSRLTLPGTMLGTPDYMAPEQAADAGSVDIRADIYALGGTLFWCLAGRAPFPIRGNLIEEVARRVTQAPPSIKSLRPDLPEKLDAVIARMMARDPSHRFATPQEVMQALLPFLTHAERGRSGQAVLAGLAPEHFPPDASGKGQGRRRHRLLIVDDNAQVRQFTKIALQADEFECDEAADGEEALRLAHAAPYDLVVLDIDMPHMSGHDVCRRLREDPPSPHLKIIMFSGRASVDEMAQIMNEGADDFLTKPFSVVQLQARVRAALRLKDAQQRSEILNEHLLAMNRRLETIMSAQDADFGLTRKALVLALAELVETRSARSAAHLLRMQHYCRRLAEEAAQSDCWRGRLDDSFISMLECCVPLRDIGNAALPDQLLGMPGLLTLEERLFMQTHTVLGAETFQRAARRLGLSGAFVQMSVDIIRHHHERFDGEGYPDRLQGDMIPLPARIVAVADVYDALRSRRSYKPALSHRAAMTAMLERCLGQFDPFLLQAFKSCAADFDRIFEETPT